jgi:hypothetical protein
MLAGRLTHSAITTAIYLDHHRVLFSEWANCDCDGHEHVRAVFNAVTSRVT